MTSATELDRGRAAYVDRQWTEAVARFADADRSEALAADDMMRLSTSATMVGDVVAGTDFLTRAHEKYLASGDLRGAVRAASWLGLQFQNSGDRAQSAGWFARAQRLVEEDPDDDYLPGMPLIGAALVTMYGSGDATGALALFERAAQIGARFDDPDLLALGRLGYGQASVILGDVTTGLRALDEAMVSVTAGEVSPIPSGIIYCAVIGTCHLAFDVRRAYEWTLALDHWCDTQPDLVNFSGQCQAHRAALFLLHGAWAEALEAAETAQDLFRRGDRAAGFGAFYQQGEVLRRRGEFDAAELCFREAGRSGWDPQPGLALLQLARGNVAQAQSQIQRAADSADPATRRQLLPAMAEIMLAAADVAGARAAADEFAAIAEQNPMPLLLATAAQTDGAVLVAERRPSDALGRLRGAVLLWRELEAPYEEGECRMLMGRACRALGDDDSTVIEFDTARSIFAELGAKPALAELDALARAHQEDARGPLTAREIEVLRLVSAGLTNRQVAERLYLSEKTVARHLSNIFTKLDLPSRAAATAYAYEHQLVS
ncbi:helix-turn-helix transcriptional regulator [Salinibacterium sp. ZJ454]|uniref:helix-turn-helix domain-containing protein n=1 Tax=Salinibacterium sp. ZJ454 TaxID=2708339 RepID=UPI00141F80D2|nr:helix-turn-helix transcriptional regulator [Salinibacterium sp. ZJ454]